MIRHGFAKVRDVTWHYAAAGSADAPVLLFLHGFPEFWYAWRHQLKDLSGSHYCVAPDLTGYNLSSKPTDVARYRMKALIEDLGAFIQEIAPKRRVVLVAHDWGGALAWAFAIRRPQFLERLIIVNAVHPGAFQRELRNNPEQRKASTYIGDLSAPDAEARYAKDNFALLRGRLDELTAGGKLDARDWAEFLTAWGQPGALTGMFNWYRAMRVSQADGKPVEGAVPIADEALMVTMPTLVLWGLKDHALLPGCVDGLERWVPQLTLETIPDYGHWINYEDPGLITRRIGEWLLAGSAPQ